MEEKQRAALRAIVTGRVQAVGFRQFVQSRGRELGLAGWVRNSADRSTVEVMAEGESGVLTTFLDHLNDGPPAARVDQVDVEWTTPVGLTEPFEIRH
jgi:acylphosphatase